MYSETSFACVTTDSGIVAGILHVSPVFVRCGPPKRGIFADRRAARASRTDARQAERPAARRRTGTAFYRNFETLA